jgi:hypothetical protein
MSCEYCGAQLSDGAQFCGNCGRPIRVPQPPPILYPLSVPTSLISPRRWLQNDKNRIKALLFLVVIISGALFLTYLQTATLQSQNTDLQSRLTELQSEANRYYSSWQDAQTQGQSLQSQVNGLQTQLDNLQAQNNYLSTQVQQLKLQSTSPTLSLWGCASPCQTSSANAWSMSVGSWREGGVPDTFTYLPQYSSTVPVGMYLLTLQQYVQFYNCPYTTDATTRITCVSGTYTYFSSTTSLNGIFHLAEGCASYVAIYYSTQSGTIYPNVQVTYNPASSSTGVCA